MSHTISYNSESHVIEIKVRGKLTSDEVREITSEITQIAVAKNCLLCLTDFRKAKLNLSTVELYELPKIISNMVASAGLDIRGFKRALLVANDSKDFGFFETATFNQAQNAKLFKSIDEARKWLSEK